MKIIYCLVIGLFLSGGGMLLRQNPNPFQQPTASEKQRIKSERLVRDYYREDIDRAKAESKREVVLPPVIEIPIVIPSVADVIRDASLLRVKVIGKETVVSAPYADINTWYKLEVSEALRRQETIDDAPLIAGAPNHFLPLLPSECLLVRPGGAITVDGVRVVRALDANQFELNLQEEYLIAANLECEGKLIRPIAQSAGVFHIEGTKLKSLDLKNRALVLEVEQMFGNDLTRLRSNIQLRKVQEK